MERAKLIDLARKLMAVTTERGASEHEALAAAGKLNSMMQEHNLTMTGSKQQDAQRQSLNAGMPGGRLITFRPAIGKIEGKMAKISTKSMTDRQLAERLELSMRTIRRYRHNGYMPRWYLLAIKAIEHNLRIRGNRRGKAASNADS